jgi:hypothetical protein
MKHMAFCGGKKNGVCAQHVTEISVSISFEKICKTWSLGGSSKQIPYIVHMVAGSSPKQMILIFSPLHFQILWSGRFTMPLHTGTWFLAS